MKSITLLTTDNQYVNIDLTVWHISNIIVNEKQGFIWVEILRITPYEKQTFCCVEIKVEHNYF